MLRKKPIFVEWESSDIILSFNITITLFSRALVIFDARAFSFMPTSDIYARGVDEKT